MFHEAQKSKIWTKNNVLHRDRAKGPAVIWSDGTKEYWENGKRYNRDGSIWHYHSIW
jgi:hypothetical protein